MSEKMVTVACRLPAGLLAEVGAVGGENYRSIHFKGVHTQNAIIENGHALTRVPESFWDAWAEAHKGAAYLVNRMIYAAANDNEARVETKLAEATGKSGFEPLNPDNPVSEIEVDREHLKKARLDARAQGVA